ncbi:beta-N-acetylhexosaminidase [Bacillus benzoevorans]|uniref:beta-N-acetylhexosaminidase n=1 Tax=Bacillus benzoevorans TaxID=1456 RepID=A0A7X0LW27_9BACI|nr:beta-N-acetylhexosaminidase [Bacillus benzoevorans]MBB6446155.1 beta-glucosidase-like glycosyl hydrolase [Bacillus benzoevorans]
MVWKRLMVFAVVLVAALFVVQFMMSGEDSEETRPSPMKPAVDDEQPVNPKEQTTEVDAVAKTLAEMSLEEKIGQMLFAGISGTEMSDSTNRLINSYHVGGLIFYKNNIASTSQIVTLQNEIRAANAGGRLPLLLGVDQEGGRISRLPNEVTNLPTSLAIGNVNNPAYAFEIGTLLGKEVKAFGFNLDFAPVLDVNSNPNNPVIGDRSFGKHPEMVSTLGVETMKGIESENVIPVVKHFPGHGDTSVDSHLELPTVNKSLAELEELELIPFAAAVENGADVVMAAHILLPKIDPTYPSSMSKVILTDMLREQLGFNGVIITDDMTMGAIADNYSIAQAAVQSVKAGSDIILVAHGENNIQAAAAAIKAAIENGEMKEERIDESVARIIRLKQKYNLDDAKVSNVNTAQLNEEISEVLNQYN